MDYFTIKNWKKFQHYHSSRGNPPWIKLYHSLLSSEEWIMLDNNGRVLLVACILIASQHDGRVPNNPEYIRRIAYLAETPNLKPLIDMGFLVDASTMLAECYHDASTMLASCYQVASTETETETEEEVCFKEREEQEETMQLSTDLSTGLSTDLSTEVEKPKGKPRFLEVPIQLDCEKLIDSFENLFGRDLSHTEEQHVLKWWNDYDFHQFVMPIIEREMQKYQDKHGELPGTPCYFTPILEAEAKQQGYDHMTCGDGCGKHLGTKTMTPYHVARSYKHEVRMGRSLKSDQKSYLESYEEEHGEIKLTPDHPRRGLQNNLSSVIGIHT